jgi:hypothetical protein
MLLKLRCSELSALWADRFPNIELDQFVVMPNHIHGIIAIVVGAPLAGARKPLAGARKPLAGARNETDGDGRVRATARVAPTTVGDIVGTYKSLLPP